MYYLHSPWNLKLVEEGPQIIKAKFTVFQIEKKSGKNIHIEEQIMKQRHELEVSWCQKNTKQHYLNIIDRIHLHLHKPSGADGKQTFSRRNDAFANL